MKTLSVSLGFCFTKDGEKGEKRISIIRTKEVIVYPFALH